MTAPRVLRVAALLVGASLLVGAAVVALGGPAWEPGSTEGAALRAATAARHPRVTTIDHAELARALASDAPPVLLDARSPEELAVSHLAGAVRVDPAAPDSLGVPDIQRDTYVVVYCAVGWRSAAVAEALLARGYRRVASLEGGIFAWANAGRPVHRGSARVDVVHPFDATFAHLLRPALRASTRSGDRAR